MINRENDEIISVLNDINIKLGSIERGIFLIFAVLVVVMLLVLISFFFQIPGGFTWVLSLTNESSVNLSSCSFQ
jgi:hypothetical protein